MSQFHVLITHELTTYASVLAGVVSHLRPHYRVQLVAPADLESEIARFPDALVVSDSIPAIARRSATGWILYYPDQRDLAVVGVGGAERVLEHPDLEDMLAAIDCAASLRQVTAVRDASAIAQPEQAT